MGDGNGSANVVKVSGDGISTGNDGERGGVGGGDGSRIAFCREENSRFGGTVRCLGRRSSGIISSGRTESEKSEECLPSGNI